MRFQRSVQSSSDYLSAEGIGIAIESDRLVGKTSYNSQQLYFMHTRLSESKSRSRSPKNQATLNPAAKSDKDLRGRMITNLPKQSPYLSTFSKVAAKSFKNKLPEKGLIPKLGANNRKQSEKDKQHNDESQVKKIERQLEIEKPKIMKVENQSYAILQQKLQSLEGQLQQIKDTMTKLSKKSKSSSKTKGKKSNSMGQKKQIQDIEDDVEEEYIISPTGIRRFVTQVKNPTKNYKKIKREVSGPLQPAPTPAVVEAPYYYGRLQAAAKSGESCDIEQHIIQAMATQTYMKNINPPHDHELQKVHVNIANHKHNQGRKTLVIDLDQTLIHCVQKQGNGDVVLTVQFPNKQIAKAAVNIRPYARQFLANLSKKFQIVVFTASHQCYADVVLDYLDPQKKFITHRIYRQHCYQTEEGMIIKDLRIFANRNIKDIVLIDNAPYSYHFHKDNAIPITPYYNDKSDTELISLQKFLLQHIQKAEDVRDVLIDYFKLKRYSNFSSASNLIEDLYL